MRTPAYRNNPELIRERVKRLIPEYQWQPRLQPSAMPISVEIPKRRAAGAGSLEFA
jgi:hypothetical protein